MKHSLQRIHAMLLRHYYVLRGSYTRLFDAVYWPTITMITWGFISRYFMQVDMTKMHYALGALLGAALLWDLMFRVQVGMNFAYLEEIWSRNMGHLFVSPLRLWEWCVAMMLFSFFRMMLGVVPAMLLAAPFYGFSILHLGLPLAAFMLNLALMGWWLGMCMAALLLKAGAGAESFVWALSWFLAPFCCVYYPVAALPSWLQPLSRALPASHVFEGLRALVLRGVFDGPSMLTAFLLNCFYMAVSIALLRLAFDNARREGALMHGGEY